MTKWVSFHGIALNVDCDLEPFGWFTPCGISDVEMTSMLAEGREVALDDVRRTLVRAVSDVFNLAPVDVRDEQAMLWLRA